MFLVFIAEYPYTRFFFGIPAWAIGAVIVGIQVLQYLGYDETERLVVLFVTLAVAALTARSMGLAQSLPWIPKIPYPGTGGSGGADRSASDGRPAAAAARSSTGRGARRRVADRLAGAPLPQPPRSTAAIDDQAELDLLLEKISDGGGMDASRRREAPPQRDQPAPPQPEVTVLSLRSGPIGPVRKDRTGLQRVSSSRR